MTLRRTTLVQGPPGPPGTVNVANVAFQNGNATTVGQTTTAVLPVFTLIGDSPSLPFLSRTDSVPAIQAWLTAHPQGGTLKLINPCFKSQLDFSGLLQHLTIEIEGIASILVNGGELSISPGVTIKGVGGGDGAVLGDLKAKASVHAYDYTGVQECDLRLGGNASTISGPFYITDFTGFPTNTVTDADIGATLVISSGGDGSAVGSWTILGQGLDGPQNLGASKGTSIRAVFTGGGIPNASQSGLVWSLPGGRSGSSAQIQGVHIPRAFKLTTNAFAGAINSSNAWRNWVWIKNATQAQLNGLFRIVGAESPGHVYCSAAIAFDSRYVSAVTLPEYGIGGTAGGPAVQYQIVSPMIRFEGGICALQNLYMLAPGIGVAVDGSRTTTAPWLLENVSIFSIQSPAYYPIVIDEAFEGYVRDCSFLPYTGTPVAGSGYSLVLSQSTNRGGNTGLMWLDHCTFTGGGILLANQDGFLLGQGSLTLKDCLTESMLMPVITWDPRGGQLGEIFFERISVNDHIVNPEYLIDAVVRGFAGDATTVRIVGGNRELGNPPLGPNVPTPNHLEIRQQEAITNLGGYSMGSLKEYVLERGNRLDASLIGSAASFSPTVEFGHDLSLPDPSTYGSLPGTATVTYPTIIGPDGHTNAEGNIVPVLSSASGRLTRTVYDSGGSGFTPAVGDYVMMGAWVKSQDPTQALPAQAVVILGFINSMSFDNGTRNLFLADDTSFRQSGAWRYITSIAKVTTAPGGFNELLINLAVTPQTALAFKGLWVKYVPASIGIPEDEIIRWYRHGSRSQIPNVAQGNLGIDPLHMLDWGGRATLGATALNQLSFNGPKWNTGSGSPNGTIVGSPGDVYINTAGGAATTIYVKESGTGTNTGWVGK